MESMSNLENTLRFANGINIFLRNKLIRAYQSENGAVEVPRLIEENTHLIQPELLNRLRTLAKNEDA